MRKLNWLVALVALLFGQSAMAVMYEIDWRTVDGAAFVGKSSGTDRLWGTSDDYVDPTTNLYGWSSGSVEINTLTNTPAPGDYFFGVPLFSDFFTGTIQITGEMAPSGFIENYTFTQAEYVTSWDCDPRLCGGIGFPVKNEESGPRVLTTPVSPSPTTAQVSNTGYFDPITQRGSFELDLTDTSEQHLLFGSDRRDSFATWDKWGETETFTIFNGQNLDDFLGDWGADLITHFDFVMNSGALDPNWLGLEVSIFRMRPYQNFDSEVPEAPWTSMGFGWQSVQTVYWTAADIREIAAVPEPTTLGLFAAGLAGLGFLSRRRKQAH